MVNFYRSTFIGGVGVVIGVFAMAFLLVSVIRGINQARSNADWGHGISIQKHIGASCSLQRVFRFLLRRCPLVLG